MKKNKKQTCYISILTVYASSADAMLDMLRYDSCSPATEQESSKIERLMNHRGEPADHVVQLRRFSVNGGEATDGRWRSFGCRVLDERSPDESPLSAEEALNLARIIR